MTARPGPLDICSLSQSSGQTTRVPRMLARTSDRTRGRMAFLVGDHGGMPVQLLGQDVAADLQAAPLSYPADQTAAGECPPGFRRFHVTRRLKRRDFDGAARDLMGWLMHEEAGLRVQASDATAQTGTVVVMRLGPGPLSLRIPCRVVQVIDEPRRKGFAYGTLPGHPESGEELFVLDHDSDGTVRFTVTGFSKPASFLTRLGGPISRAVQDWMTQRYLVALDRL